MPYVNSFKDRHGRTRYYFRYRGKRRALKGKPGEAVFQESYRDAEVELLGVDSGKPKRPSAGSLAAVIDSFKASDHFKNTEPSTQEVYHRRLDWLKENWGAGDIETLDEDIVRQIRDELKATPTVANRIVFFIGRLWRFAKEDLRMKLGPDPTREVARVKHEEKSAPVWPPALCKAFEALPRQSLVLAYMLMRYTGQRRSDIVKMEWSQFDGTAIEVVQQKTGTYVWIPCPKALRDYLKTIPRTGRYILMSERGDKFKATSITNMVCDAAADLGFPGYSPHGLRHLAGAALAESGCSLHEVMAILGHVTEREAAGYVKQASRKVMATSAIAKFDQKGLPQGDKS